MARDFALGFEPWITFVYLDESLSTTLSLLTLFRRKYPPGIFYITFLAYLMFLRSCVRWGHLGGTCGAKLRYGVTSEIT